ncbi:hypothetical protein [uncultured Roseobacter sp.]|uniref:hypothetical protein n=1 Tax=uncultured Roseobacter sp. TaxID=114847 RepID=UPI002632B26A|nr:hypothetical protein [uncultured Roseobacter sp.]
MHRKFIATVTAAAICITAAGVAPARANEDVLRALAAIAGVAIVAKVINDRNDRKREQTVTRNTYQPVQRNLEPVYRLEPRPLPRRVQRRLLPGDCLRSIPTRDRTYRIFGKKCMERNYSYTDELPRTCKVKFKGPNRKRKGWDARCLRQEGYQLARR